MKKILFLMVGIVLLSFVIAEASYTFKRNEQVDFRFRCLDEDNNYCPSTTLLVISIENPNGTNLMDNISMTHNPTYYNISLPTNETGRYSAIILSPTVNNSITEFTYIITIEGIPEENGVYITIWIAGFVLIYIGLIYKKLTPLYRVVGHTLIAINGVLGAYIYNNPLTLIIAGGSIIFMFKGLVEFSNKIFDEN